MTDLSYILCKVFSSFNTFSILLVNIIQIYKKISNFSPLIFFYLNNIYFIKKYYMKKVVKLTENELNNLIKNIISEMEFKEAVMNVDPYTLNATEKGNVKITNTKTGKGHIYAMEAWKKINWWDCFVKDFPGGTKIELTASGQRYVIPVDKTQIKNLLQKGFGLDELTHTLVNGNQQQEVRFTKVY